MPSVAITLNGDRTEVEGGLSIVALLERLRIEPRRVVVEHNRRILRDEELNETTVDEGDELELVQLVGGG